MNDLDASRFADFFEALWGWPPFAWQQDLARRVLDGVERSWPDAIALPTAAGKTACLDIAVFALAARASERDGVRIADAPRRIFFVVDRRVIVDEAFERARRIALKLRTAESGVVREVADRLRALAGGNNPLMCFQLRGGMYRSDAWARSPLQPAIIASTVDQVGSRLLFRAYGRSSKAWPIQAGLAGNDALILLDEAHCSQPFMETLHAVRKYRQWADAPVSSHFHVAIMSATPPDTLNAFRDTSEEPRTAGHPLGDRQLATKKTILKQTRAGGKKAHEELAAELAKTAEELVGSRPLAAVVFVNYVATARAVHRLLKKKHGENAILLTGRMRPIDKDDTVLERLKKFDLSSARSKERALDGPVFVIATQTLEVGADLDFDILVTECASLDALLQRFGRLDRLGRPIEALGAILMRADLEKSSAEDPVYGESLGLTWRWLNEQAGEDREIDMGIASLGSRLAGLEDRSILNAPTEHAPVMLPAHVDCWGQTRPEPAPSPDVSVFLHGPGRASADVQVLWRADIDLSDSEPRDLSLDALALCPPATAESLAVPIWVMRRWMDKEGTAIGEISDVEGVVGGASTTGAVDGAGVSRRRVVRWRGRDEAEVVAGGRRIRPGDVIVIPAAEEEWDALGDLPSLPGETPVLDWGDRAYAAMRAKAMLRLHPSVVAMWPEGEYKDRFMQLSHDARDEFDEDPDGFVASLKDGLRMMAEDETAPGWLRRSAAALANDAGLKRSIIPHPLNKGVILRSSAPIENQALDASEEEVDWFSDEDDAAASGTVPVSLVSHLEGVSNLANRFASGCALPKPLVSAIETAGRLHDLGKADPRFQALLRGGNPWAVGELLAKSDGMPQGYLSHERARKAVGYPRGGRHELLSVRMAESAPGLLPEEAEYMELVMHLIGSHHGHCRPFAPVVDDPGPVEASVELDGHRPSARSDTGLERLDSGVAERFWRLTRRYGWWGLAWLEAIVRLSDHRRSEREELGG